MMHNIGGFAEMNDSVSDVQKTCENYEDVSQKTSELNKNVKNSNKNIFIDKTNEVELSESKPRPSFVNKKTYNVVKGGFNTALLYDVSGTVAHEMSLPQWRSDTIDDSYMPLSANQPLGTIEVEVPNEDEVPANSDQGSANRMETSLTLKGAIADLIYDVVCPQLPYPRMSVKRAKISYDTNYVKDMGPHWLRPDEPMSWNEAKGYFPFPMDSHASDSSQLSEEALQNHHILRGVWQQYASLPEYQQRLFNTYAQTIVSMRKDEQTYVNNRLANLKDQQTVYNIPVDPTGQSALQPIWVQGNKYFITKNQHTFWLNRRRDYEQTLRAEQRDFLKKLDHEIVNLVEKVTAEKATEEYQLRRAEYEGLIQARLTRFSSELIFVIVEAQLRAEAKAVALARAEKKGLTGDPNYRKMLRSAQTAQESIPITTPAPLNVTDEVSSQEIIVAINEQLENSQKDLPTTQDWQDLQQVAQDLASNVHQSDADSSTTPNQTLGKRLSAKLPFAPDEATFLERTLDQVDIVHNLMDPNDRNLLPSSFQVHSAESRYDDPYEENDIDPIPPPDVPPRYNSDPSMLATLRFPFTSTPGAHVPTTTGKQANTNMPETNEQLQQENRQLRRQLRAAHLPNLNPEIVPNASLHNLEVVVPPYFEPTSQWASDIEELLEIRGHCRPYTAALRRAILPIIRRQVGTSYFMVLPKNTLEDALDYMKGEDVPILPGLTLFKNVPPLKDRPSLSYERYKRMIKREQPAIHDQTLCDLAWGHVLGGLPKEINFLPQVTSLAGIPTQAQWQALDRLWLQFQQQTKNVQPSTVHAIAGSAEPSNPDQEDILIGPYTDQACVYKGTHADIMQRLDKLDANVNAIAGQIEPYQSQSRVQPVQPNQQYQPQNRVRTFYPQNRGNYQNQGNRQNQGNYQNQGNRQGSYQNQGNRQNQQFQGRQNQNRQNQGSVNQRYDPPFRQDPFGCIAKYGQFPAAHELCVYHQMWGKDARRCEDPSGQFCKWNEFSKALPPPNRVASVTPTSNVTFMGIPNIAPGRYAVLAMDSAERKTYYVKVPDRSGATVQFTEGSPEYQRVGNAGNGQNNNNNHNNNNDTENNKNIKNCPNGDLSQLAEPAQLSSMILDPPEDRVHMFERINAYLRDFSVPTPDTLTEYEFSDLEGDVAADATWELMQFHAMDEYARPLPDQDVNSEEAKQEIARQFEEDFQYEQDAYYAYDDESMGPKDFHQVSSPTPAPEAPNVLFSQLTDLILAIDRKFSEKLQSIEY